MGYLLALLAAGAWAQNSIVYTLAGKRVSSNTTTHIRLWIALPASMIMHFIFLKTFIPSGIGVNDLIILSSSGIVGFFLADILIFRGFLYLGPRDTMLIMTLSPVFSSLLSIPLLGEFLKPLQFLGIIVTIAGIAFVILEKAGKNTEKVIDKRDRLKGILFALLGALGQSLGIIIAKFSLNNNMHPVSANFIRLLAGFIAIVLYFAFRKQLISDFKKMKDTKALGLISFGAVVGPTIGVVGALYAVKYIPVGIASTLMQTTPIFLLPIERIMFKKTITIRAFIGTLITIIGVGIIFII